MVKSPWQLPMCAPAAGNEGNVEGFVNNTGLMWELGREWGAMLVFAEVR